MHLSCFVRSFVDGHLARPCPGCCKCCCREHGVHSLFELVVSFSLDKKPELLEPVAALVVIIWGISTLLSQWLHKFTSPRAVHEGSFPFLPPRQHVALGSLMTGFLQMRGGISLQFRSPRPWGPVMWAPVRVPVGHLYIFLGKMSIQALCPCFIWTVGGFAAEL